MRPPATRVAIDTAPWWRRNFGLILAALILTLAPAFAYAQGTDSAVVTWTAPGDDGSIGTAGHYDLRVSTSEINAGNFASAEAVQGLPSPATPGTRQRFTVRGLTRGTTYFFAIRTADDQNNWSPISNVLRHDWIVDSAPPAQPPQPSGGVEGGNIHLSWSPSPDPDLEGYNVYRAFESVGPYTLLTSQPLASPEFVDSSVPEGTPAVWYRVTAVDVHGNESAQSTTLSVELAPSLAAASIEPGYPNPSRLRDAVRIPVLLSTVSATTAVVDVIDSGGRRVRHLEASLPPGRQELVWDGKNDAGREVAPGVYRAWLVSGGARTSIRLVRVP